MNTLQEAVSLHAQGQFERAVALYLQILEHEPQNADVMHLLGLATLNGGHAARAVGLLRESIAINPVSVAAQANLARALQATGNRKEALDHFDLAISAAPGNIEVLMDRGNLLAELNRMPESLASFDAVLAINPAHVGALNNRGKILALLRRHQDALLALDAAIAQDPGFVPSWVNRGNVLTSLCRFDEAYASFEHARAIAPDSPDVRWNASFLKLLRGDFHTGWEDFEARWAIPAFAQRRHVHLPVWQGDHDIRGKRVLLWYEQGFGDTLQFCRYAIMVAALGAVVVLEVQPALKPLLAASLRHAALVIAAGEPVPPCDFALPLMSLPHAFRTDSRTVPYAPAYLQADPVRVVEWEANLGARAQRLRIGVSFSGNVKHKSDMERSLNGALFEPLARRADLFIVQKGLREADASMLGELPGARYLGDHLGDFSDTAAVIANLDLVISVDTSLAHLAGALGKPVWVLLPASPDWRWQLDRDDSPWYPSARLFRQRQAGDWREVIGRVVHALEGFEPV
jgi:tetratricopeptide (TPR) repeat protein